MTRGRDRRRHQRGAVAVELALGAPLLCLIVLGGVHLGKVMMTRHELTEATNVAVRAAAISHRHGAADIRAAIQARLGPGSGCAALLVRSETSRDAFGVGRLDVTARCAVTTGIGGALLGALGPAEVSVRVAMPY